MAEALELLPTSRNPYDDYKMMEGIGNGGFGQV